MPVNWENINIEEIIEGTSNRTDERLASKISSLTRMTDEEVKQLFPESADVEKLAKLMKIVKSSEDRNTKINKISKNAEEFSGIVLTILGKFV